MDAARLTLFLLTSFPYASTQRVLSEIRRRFATLQLQAPSLPDLSGAAVLPVEAPPSVEPAVLTEQWSDPGFLSHWLGRPACLGGVVALLDARCVLGDLGSDDRLADRGWAASPFDGRSVADLVVEQIESASIVVLLDPDDRLEATRRKVRVLNPTARIAPCSSDDLELPPRLLSVEATPHPVSTPPWLRALRGAPPWHEGFREGHCLDFRRRLPFDPERLARWLERPLPGLVRGKGYLWLSDRDDERIGYSRAGSLQRTFQAGGWWASAAPGRWPACPTQAADLLSRWDPRVGDREQRLVLIGDDFDPVELERSLDECLVSDSARHPDGAAFH